ncbi:MAG: hypothetical protein DMG30_05410 [Acidobacteria bacterium]|nr:MAG: hypothetical protein DMG30_05410 [Acidobacteriota bacterium]
MMLGAASALPSPADSHRARVVFAGLAVIIAPTNNDQAPRPSLPRSMQANALPRSALAQRMRSARMVRLDA